MRVLPVVVVLESIALVGLAVQWTRPPASRPLGGALQGIENRHTDGPAPRAGAVAAPDAAEPHLEIAPPDRRVATPGADPSSGIVVRGTLTTTDGSELPEAVSVYFRKGAVARAATEVGHEFAIAGLTPGTWQVSARADRFVVHDGECTLGSAPTQTHDIALQPAYVVDVFVRGPDGGQLHGVLNELGLYHGLHVVATDEALNTDLAPTDNSSVGDLGIGRYRGTSELGRSGPPDEPDGALWLDREPPANAALLMRHVVLAQQPIAAGQRELRFVVAADDLRGRLGSVAMRLVDGATGAPLTSGVTVRIATAQGGGQRGTPDADGRLVVERVQPGLGSLELVGGRGREHLWDLVRVPPGGTVDLGDVALFETVELRGRVCDPEGAPIPGGTVQWSALSTMRFPRELVDRRSSSADGDGVFRLELGRRRYVVIARDDSGRRGYAHVDARGGPPEPIDIRVFPAARVVVRAPAGTLEGFVATIRDGDGVPVAARAIEPRFPSQTLSVPPGAYTLEVHGHDDRLAKRTTLALHAGDETIVEVGR